jgi:hypothetical protein
MIDIVTEEGGITTMKWDTYHEIMRDRYNNGKFETKSIIIGAIRSLLDTTTDDTLTPGLTAALQIAKEAYIDHDAKSMGQSVG